MTFIATGPQTYTNILSGTGVDPTGASDSTTGIAAVRSAVNAAGGGVVYWPPGTYLSGNQPIYSNVTDIGAGPGATTIKLKNGANTDLFSAQTSSINLAAASGASIIGTIANFSFQSMTLEGNKANQTAGPSYPLRVYGYKFILRDMVVKNGYSGGILTDWNGGAEIAPFASSDQMESTLDNLTIHSNGGIGLQMGGPHDSRLLNITCFDNASHGFHLAPNMLGTLCVQIHPYQQQTGVGAVGILCEGASSQFSNCEFEGSDTAQVVLLASDCSIIGGEIFGNIGSAGTGLQLGQQAGQTPIVGQVYQSGGVTTAVAVTGTYIATSFRNCDAGAINEANVGILNTYICDVYQSTGSAISSGGGYLSSQTTALLTVRGLTADGSTGKGGTFQIGNGSFNGLEIYDTNGTAIFNVNTFNSIFAVLNGKQFTGYSDSGSTSTYSLHADTGNITTPGNIAISGNIAIGQSATAPATATGGTIATLNIGISRVAPTANITGVILTAGAIVGQTVTVINESAFTITFAAAATSNVADGVSAVIAANRKMDFTWDSATSRWYHN